MIDDQQSDGVVALLQTAQEVERNHARFGAHDAILLTVMLAQVALDRAQDFGIVVDGQDDWSRHRPSLSAALQLSASLLILQKRTTTAASRVIFPDYKKEMPQAGETKERMPMHGRLSREFILL